MKQTRNTYSRGINQDVSFSKITPDFYFNAWNFRIITRDGKSTGSLSNEKGHELLVQIPNIEQDGIKPAQNNLEVIGATTIRDTIVVFTTNETSSTPTNSYGQIWTITYTDEYIPTISLKYNEICNFSTYYPIKAIGNYENEKVQKVYWTDDYNQFRSFNIADTYETATIIDKSPDWNFNNINIDSIENGGSFVACNVKYAYSQYNKNYSETAIQGLTDVIQINDYSFVKDPSSFVGKSVSISISLDSNFDSLILYRIQYEQDNSNPSIYIVYDGLGKGTFNFTDKGEKTFPTISLAEFLLTSNNPYIVKDFQQKDNRLFIGNIIESNFDVLYDARAYRFSTNQVAKLYNKNDVPEYLIDGKSPMTPSSSDFTQWNQIPLDADAITPNLPSQTTDNTAPGYKNYYNKSFVYQKDGITIGGEGRNIKYTFGISTKKIDNNKNNIGDLDVLESETNFDNSLYTLRGYMRNEIYRFGIIFYNKKGQSSPVKWIGDIRFPDYHDYYDTEGGNRVPAPTDLSGDETNSKILYIKFNITNIPSGVYKYQIVRADRDSNNKTMFGTAIMNPTVISYDLENNEASDDKKLMIHPFPISPRNYQLLGSSSAQKALKDHMDPFFDLKTDVRRDGTYYYNNLYSKELQSSTFVPDAESDFIDSIGWMGYEAMINYDPKETNIVTALNNPEYDFPNGINKDSGYFLGGCKNIILKGTASLSYYNEPAASWFNNVNTKKRINLSGSAKIPDYDSTGRIVKSYRFLNDYGFNTYPTFVNYFRAKNYKYISADYNKNAITYGGPSLLTGMRFSNSADMKAFIMSGVEAVGYKKLIMVRYGRYLTKQYGGYFHDARQKTEYITCSPLYDISVSDIDVFQGDTFITYNHMLMNRSLSGLETWATSSVKLMIPLENTINGNYDTGFKSSQWRNELLTSAQFTSVPIINNTQNTIQTYIPSDDNFQEINTFDTEVRYSEVKFANEEKDSFLKYRSNNLIDVEGQYGPINAMTKWNNEIFVFQDNAFSRLLINPTPQVLGTDNITVSLGKGDVIQKAQYVSTSTGSYNRFGIVSAPTGIFYFDLLNRKLMRYNGQLSSPQNDIKGLSGHFRKELRGFMSSLKIDNPVLRQGVTASYDVNNSECLYTIMANNSFTVTGSTTSFTTEKEEHSSLLKVGDIITINITSLTETKGSYKGIITFIKDGIIYFSTDHSFSIGETWTITYYIGSSYTVIFNDLLNSFSSFYNYSTATYINDTKNLISTNNSNNALYIHGVGDYGVFYGSTPQESVVEIIVNGIEYSSINKIFDSIEFYSECFDVNGNDIPNETIDKIEISNSYQTTGEIDLIPGENIRKRHRNWFLHIPRQKDTRNRIKDNWVKIKLIKKNTSNNRFILHDIITNFRPINY